MAAASAAAAAAMTWIVGSWRDQDLGRSEKEMRFTSPRRGGPCGGDRDRDREGCAEWMGYEERENPTWIAKPLMPSMPLAIGYRLGMIF
jgi:hypothetical protein